MGSGYTVALTGDAILNTRVSRSADPGVIAVAELLRSADASYGHVEVPLHDFSEPDSFPAAEGALSWMSGPTSSAAELRWFGIDIVSVASNHALDYSYGGLRSTLAALDAVGLPRAGAGRDLGEASAPAFLDASAARIGLVSATASFPTFARAGAARVDMIGRPGVNGLRHLHVIDARTAQDVIALAGRLGSWVTQLGDEIVVNPPGLHNTIQRFRVDPAATAVTTACDEDDLARITRAIGYARSVADFVIAQLHSHEWDAADGRMCTSPSFVQQFAHAAVDAGASVVVVQGSHAPIRGIEVHDGVPILYDPGPLFRLGRRDRQPQDFYVRWGSMPAARRADAGVVEAFASRDNALGGGDGTHRVLHPAAGVSHDPGFLIPICEVDSRHRVVAIALHPATWLVEPKVATGHPVLATGAVAAAILELASTLSAPYGTRVSITGDVGRIAVS